MHEEVRLRRAMVAAQEKLAHASLMEMSGDSCTRVMDAFGILKAALDKEPA